MICFLLHFGCLAHCYLWMGHPLKYSKGKGHFDLFDGEVLAKVTYLLITLNTRYVQVLLEQLIWQGWIYVGLFAARSLSGSHQSVDQGIGFIFVPCQVQVLQYQLAPQFEIIAWLLRVRTTTARRHVLSGWAWDSVVKRQIISSLKMLITNNILFFYSR